MKSTLLILLLALLGGGGAAWHFYSDEIREIIGIPEETVDLIEKEDMAGEARTGIAAANPDETAARPLDKRSQQDIRIEQIVTERYPGVKSVPFEEAFRSRDSIPVAAYPKQVTIDRAVSFKYMQGGKLVGASYVKAGGKIRPFRLDGKNLIAVSLANDQIRTKVLLSETDFMEVVKSNYEGAMENAIERIQKMKDEDRSDFKSDQRLFGLLESEKRAVWSDVSESRFSHIKNSLAGKFPGKSFEAIHYFYNGTQRVEDETHTGFYDVTIVLLKGYDRGFGPYLWRARYLYRDGRSDWTGLPE